MSLKCKLLGHKWVKSNEEYREKCSNKNCICERVLMWNRHPAIGELSYSWEIIDFQKYKF